MSRAKDLATMIFRRSAGYVRKALARHVGAWSDVGRRADEVGAALTVEEQRGDQQEQEALDNDEAGNLGLARDVLEHHTLEIRRRRLAEPEEIAR